MNKYTELSDFEINKKVAEKLSITCEFDMGTVIIYRDSECHAFDPCNSPADAMPIIIENGIAFMPSKALDSCYCVKGDYSSTNKSLYRAAMEVFLMMKDVECGNERA